MAKNESDRDFKVAEKRNLDQDFKVAWWPSFLLAQPSDPVSWPAPWVDLRLQMRGNPTIRRLIQTSQAGIAKVRG